MFTDDGRITGTIDLPLSAFLDEQARKECLRWGKWNEAIVQGAPGHWTDPAAVSPLREYFDQHFYPDPIARSLELYPVRIETKSIAGVNAEVISPARGTGSANRARVLINLHGGGFTVGAGYGGRLEAIPVACLGDVQVISVDYRMAPEYEFPAATDDVLAVYRAALNDYPARNIGIFGCSAGAILTAQVTARLIVDGLPLPGALGMLCGSGCYWGQGDSAHLGVLFAGEPIRALQDHPYFRRADANDPMVFPALSDAFMRQFPPSLLVGGTRDWVLSSVVHMHNHLILGGVEARLHVWEGLGHAFFYDPDLPQSKEVHRVLVKFFDDHLGR